MTALNRKRYVVDASVVLKWFSQAGESELEKALKLRDDHRDKIIEVYSPELLVYEVANVLRFKESISEKIISQAISSIYDMDIVIPANPRIMAEAVRTARMHAITVYDSCYLSFAWEIGAHLITADKKLYLKIQNLPGVIYIADY